MKLYYPMMRNWPFDGKMRRINIRMDVVFVKNDQILEIYEDVTNR